MAVNDATNNYDYWPKCRYCSGPSYGTEMIGVGFVCAHCCVMETHLRDRGIENEWIELTMLTMVAEANGHD